MGSSFREADGAFSRPGVVRGGCRGGRGAATGRGSQGAVGDGASLHNKTRTESTPRKETLSPPPM